MRAEITWAMEALDRHVRGGRSPFAKDGPWTEIVRSADAAAQSIDAMADYAPSSEDAAEEARARIRRAPLRTRDVERMNRALGWIEAALPAEGGLRQLVAVVGMLSIVNGPHISWRSVMGWRRRHADASAFCGSPDTVRMRHSRAITAICHHANTRRGSVTC
jgi:hypothetical protein